MPETLIRAALQRFDTAVKAGDGPGLSAALTEIERLLAAHEAALPPQLAHFLAGRSYAKALAWLGGQGSFGAPANPAGGCGRGPGR